MNTRSVGNRQTVNVGLTFGDPQRPQADARSGEKFNKKLEAVAQREERRRRKPKKEEPEEDGEEAATEVGVPLRKGPAGAMAQSGVANRQKALHAQVKQKPAPMPPPRATTVPRVLAEAVTDPGFKLPAQFPPAGQSLFAEQETGLLQVQARAPTDPPSIPLLDDDAFEELAEVDEDAVEMLDTSHYGGAAEEVTEREDVPPKRKR